MNAPQNKIVRSVCYFTDNPSAEVTARISDIVKKLEDKGYLVQTKRVCSAGKDIAQVKNFINGEADYISIGTTTLEGAFKQLPIFYDTDNANFNVNLTEATIRQKHADLLFKIIKEKPSLTFNFGYVFNNNPSSPFFPSGNYEKNGFSVGLQATDLAEDCAALEEWFAAMLACWGEIADLFHDDSEFLGIDSSVAPMASGKSSFINFVKRLGYDFAHSTTTDLYVTITRFIKENNPKLTGLSGLMFPCLEDAELAAEYDQGNFSIERNVYLSLHSGLGIDTYPIGTDEKPERVVEILKLLQALSNKYQKPLSARFVSDGKAKIGQETDFRNQYLTDCTVRAL